MMVHEHYMRMCFELALKGAGNVAPNPLVGAVIVQDGKILSTGYHHKVGHAHAELDAIEKAEDDLRGSTLYCNLEPCCHTNKRTPPCAQRIMQEGISEVIISNLDPNPEVAGKGIQLLKDHGINVITGILEEEGRLLNEIFFHHIIHHQPFVHLKMAQTLDGKLASRLWDSKWITTELSRQKVHDMRNHYDAILVGANTIRQDNPTLTVRREGYPTKAIKRIILSCSGELDKNFKIFTDEFKHLTYVVTPPGLSHQLPCKTIICPLNDQKEFDLKILLPLLYKDFGITSLFVEGGQKVHTSFIHQHAYDRISIFIAPKILGEGHATIGDLGKELMTDAIHYQNVNWQQIGSDNMFTARRAP